MSVLIEKRYLIVSTFVMELQISSDRYIWEIQRDFSQLFGYLKIEFFSRSQQIEKRSPAKNIISNQRRIAELVKSNVNASIAIYDGMSVSELEKLFSDQFNLSAQVFRRSGNIWLETTMTDGWSLKQQNDHGKEITVGIPKSPPDYGNTDRDLL